MDAGGVGRREAAVERVEEVAVDEGGAVDELGGVDEVAGALLVDVHGGLREGGGHVAHPAGVVEVDVGDGDAGQVVGGDASSSSAARSAGTEDWLPVSTRTGAVPVTR